MRFDFLVSVLFAIIFTDAVSATCNRDDTAFWKSGGGYESRQEMLDRCGLSKVFQEGTGSPQEKATKCIRETQPKYSEGCAECFGNTIACARIQCDRECTSTLGSQDADCIKCTQENCEPVFENCAGFPLNSCTDCFVPDNSQIVDGIDNGAFAAIVAVLVACLVFVPFFCYFFIYQRPENATLTFQVADAESIYKAHQSLHSDLHGSQAPNQVVSLTSYGSASNMFRDPRMNGSRGNSSRGSSSGARRPFSGNSFNSGRWQNSGASVTSGRKSTSGSVTGGANWSEVSNKMFQGSDISSPLKPKLPPRSSVSSKTSLSTPKTFETDWYKVSKTVFGGNGENGRNHDARANGSKHNLMDDEDDEDRDPDV